MTPEQIAPNRWRCKVCRVVFRVTNPAGCHCLCPAGINGVLQAEASPETIRCEYRGEHLRDEDCTRCGGVRREAVHICSKFGEASIRPVRGVAGCCLRCPVLWERIDAG